METFGEEISAEACSGKEIAGLVRKMMMMKEERNKMPTPRHKATHNPITTSFVLLKDVVCLFVRQSKQHNILKHENVCCGLGRNNDVGMGL